MTSAVATATLSPTTTFDICGLMNVHSSHNLTVYGKDFHQVGGNQYNETNYISAPRIDDRSQILRKLADHAAINASHDSEPSGSLNCHPNTRVRALQTLHKWIIKRMATTRVQWVYGSAGVGKSAIAQKVADSHRSRLVGAFFFSRNDTTRDTLDPFVATIAYQCCTSSRLGKVVGHLIIDAIRSDPNIFNAPIKVQFRKLILEPFSKVKWFQRWTLPNLLVIDGLDECIDHSSQQRLLELFDFIFNFSTPVSFKILLCSRPEPQICHGIERAYFSTHLGRIEISGSTVRFTGYLTESDLDIQRYLQEKFTELRKKYRGALQDEGEVWPNKDALDNLVSRASGQFIFAVTIIKYIDTIDELPQDRLKTVLNAPLDPIPDSPYPALDLLYQQILSTCRHWDRVYPILRILVTPDPLDKPTHSAIVIASVCKLKKGEVQVYLSRLHSVIHVPDDPHSEIRILHASFTEFLLDLCRSGDHHVPQYTTAEYCDHIAVHLLRILSSYHGWYPPYRSSDSFGAAFYRWKGAVDCINIHTRTYFSLRYWPDYVRGVESPSGSLLAELLKFDPYVVGALNLSTNLIFHDWNRCLTSTRVWAPQTFVSRMESFLQGCHVGYSTETFLHDAIQTTFMLEHGISGSLEWQDADQVFAIVSEYYERWWPGKSRKQGYCYPMLLPLNSYPHELPDNWAVLYITKTNAHMLERVKSMYRSLGWQYEEILKKDILFDTSESVKQNFVEEKDLAELKAFLYERRDLLAYKLEV
ncbi:hypothetical protein VNI00_008785 [Paramarasmius palmivorus]|uniref:Nephrocystin 3-like N-terminal domain-containing protein n=1 Tax=Paramarasmius palmivorus TaxID=297713 RepID=A0AAW0CW23_9AGAR